MSSVVFLPHRRETDKVELVHQTLETSVDTAAGEGHLDGCGWEGDREPELVDDIHMILVVRPEARCPRRAPNEPLPKHERYAQTAKRVLHL